LALAGAGFWSLSSDPVRTVAGFAALVLALAVLAAGLGCVSWLGGRMRRGQPA
jgi:hypothetical protein